MDALAEAVTDLVRLAAPAEAARRLRDLPWDADHPYETLSADDVRRLLAGTSTVP